MNREDAEEFLKSLSDEQVKLLDKMIGFRFDPDAEREVDRAALRRAGIVVPQ